MGRWTLFALAAGLAVAFLAGRASELRSAAAGEAAHTYTGRVGDTILLPSIAVRCAVYVEATSPNLFCSHLPERRAHHQVVLFRDRLLVYRVGDPDAPPVFSGRP